MQAPFLARGWDVRRFFYFGEGVILSAVARPRAWACGCSSCASPMPAPCPPPTTRVFCSVRRPDDHPLRPAQPHTNDAFWRRRGYVPLPGMSLHHDLAGPRRARAGCCTRWISGSSR